MAGGNILSMVLVEPPAPADLVLVGRALAIFSFWSAAARRRIAVRGPPGGVGDDGRPMLAPLAAPVGEEARGEDCRHPIIVSQLVKNNTHSPLAQMGGHRRRHGWGDI